MNCVTKQSVSSYVSLLDSLIPPSKNTKQALVLGLGGGLTANLLCLKNYTVDGVEFDNRIINVAKNYFYLNKTVNTICADARYFLNHCTKKYNVVLVDVFKAEEQPSHVLTLQSLSQLKNNLTPNALVLINWHGYVNGSIGIGTTILKNTLQKAGFNVQLTALSTNPHYRNIIFVASLQTIKPLNYSIKNQSPMPCHLINTDNFPLLEKYNALANKTWRSNYLKYYQNQ